MKAISTETKRVQFKFKLKVEMKLKAWSVHVTDTCMATVVCNKLVHIIVDLLDPFPTQSKKRKVVDNVFFTSML